MRMDRREFLKLSALLPISSMVHPAKILKSTRMNSNPNSKNILIILFDALSACNVSFLGYPRETMPKLSRLLERATVYHEHYAPGNYTTPGTASLLTGTYPWTHRALKLFDAVTPQSERLNIFRLFDQYDRIAYTHNLLVEVFLNQFSEDITFHKPSEELYLSSTWWLDRLFKPDFDAASLAWNRITDPTLDGLLYSLLFSKYIRNYLQKLPSEITDMYPRGLPSIGRTTAYFTLEQAIDWMKYQIIDSSQPFLGYFHLLPPHAPYRTRRDFIDAFLGDGWEPPDKNFLPIEPRSRMAREELLELRREYDEYILLVDSEFDRLFTSIEQEGLLENTWVVVTSDHGESFERGINGHGTPHVYQPVVKIPLIIYEPGQKSRRDVHTPTCAVDVLPTLLHVNQLPLPDGLEGEILPPYRETGINSDREIYALQSKLLRDRLGPIVTGTMMMIKDHMKVIRYFGYQDAYDYEIVMDSDPLYEVYNIFDDPEELNDLSRLNTTEVKQSIGRLEEKYQEVSGVYQ
jgi:arylsulfatase A-like enzyme